MLEFLLMGTSPPILDYAPRPRRPRLRRLFKWLCRGAIVLLMLLAVYATPIVWLYWGWRQERQVLDATHCAGYGTTRIGPAVLDWLVPQRLVWVRDRITSVHFWPTGATDNDLRPLNRLSFLQSVNVDDTRITDAGLVYLKDLTKLRSLSLERTRITGDGLACLNGLTSLERLSLHGTKITDAGLAHLTDLNRLKELDLQDTAVTYAGVEDLARGLAATKVFSRWGTFGPSIR